MSCLVCVAGIDMAGYNRAVHPLRSKRRLFLRSERPQLVTHLLLHRHER
jgi:hypothetical protein